jgi:hypothetical protein
MGLGDEGKSSDVVVVGVGENYGVQILRNLIEERGGIPTVAAWVHSRIEHNRGVACLKKVGVGPDFWGTG